MVVTSFSRQAERGELKIERYVEHEAGLLVRRAFGASKRLSQAEKNDIHRLVALRTQYAKEVWQVSIVFGNIINYDAFKIYQIIGI